MDRLTALCRSLKALLLAALAGSVVVQQATAQADPDAAAWAAARDAGTAEACQRYLEEFPTGRHAEDAFRCLVEEALPPLAPVAPRPDVPAVEPPRRPLGPDSDRGGVIFRRLPRVGPAVPPAEPY